MAFITRPVIDCTRGAVAAGHYLAAEAGLRIFHLGGNAVDSAVAMGFALAVLKPDQNGIGGESPILIYSADKGCVFSINGQGVAPRAATMEQFRKMGIKLIPGDGYLPATVPSAVDNYLVALAVFGSLPLSEVLAPAVELAQNGFPMYESLGGAFSGVVKRWQDRYPTSMGNYLPDGIIPRVGDIYRQKTLADTLTQLIEAERKAASRGRVQALRAAREVFYKGDIARQIVSFSSNNPVLDASGSSHVGLFCEQDFADYQACIEPAVSADYRGLTVHKCNTWCQGVVFLQQLRLLEGYDLNAFGHNTPDYIHTVIECAKLAFADRNAYYGDPAFVKIPLKRLLSDDYNDLRRQLVDPQRASLEDRPGEMEVIINNLSPSDKNTGEWPALHTGDTTKCDAVDSQGNMISITPSGGWFMSSPAIPSLGFPLGTRGQMFELDHTHPNCLAPGKRPRSTLTPSLVTKDGKPWMVFGTPGGDCQDQWTLQFFLNYVDLGMDLQEAIDKPTFHSQHFRNSFYPRQALPGHLTVEGRIDTTVIKELEARGHLVTITDDWANGQVEAIRFDADTGLISAAASPRGVSYAIGW